MEIRPIEMKDNERFLNLLTRLEPTSQGAMYGEQQMNLSNTEDLLSSVLQDAKKEILVALDGREMMGYISLTGNNNEMTHHRATVSLGIIDDEEESKIGRNLLNAGIRWAEDHGIHRLELSIRDDFRKVMELYKTLGFLKEGERVDALFIDGEFKNEIYLYRLIS